jgi:hypothetical protein
VELDVTGSIKQSGILFNSDGSASSPSITFTSDTNTGLYRIGSDIIGISANGSKIGEFNTNGIQALDNILIVEDEKTANTNGGTFNTGAWRTRHLTIIRINRIAGASVTLAANNTINPSPINSEITLPAGRYRIQAKCPAVLTDRHKTRLFNITDTVSVIDGSSGYVNGNVQTISIILGEFVIASQKTFIIQHYAFTSSATSGFGVASNFSVPEVYTQVIIQRLT